MRPSAGEPLTTAEADQVGSDLAMSSCASCTIRSLGPEDVGSLRDVLRVFSEAFDDAETYCGAQPSRAYLE